MGREEEGGLQLPLCCFYVIVFCRLRTRRSISQRKMRVSTGYCNTRQLWEENKEGRDGGEGKIGKMTISLVYLRYLIQTEWVYSSNIVPCGERFFLFENLECLFFFLYFLLFWFVVRYAQNRSIEFCE